MPDLGAFSVKTDTVFMSSKLSCPHSSSQRSHRAQAYAMVTPDASRQRVGKNTCQQNSMTTQHRPTSQY